jgi:hypothetical protein
MPKATKEVEVGGRYTCYVRGKQVVVYVDEIDKSPHLRHSTVRILCHIEDTSKRVILRSPSRLIAQLGGRIPNFK